MSFFLSYSYTSYSSSSPHVSIGSIVEYVFGSFTGLGILIVILRCCCAAINYASRQTETVLQPSHTAMQTFIVNPCAISQGQTVTPAQQEAVGYAFPSAGPPPQYVQHQNVSEKKADLACHSPQEAKY
ncbi:hypothetical protein ACJMK2_000417 [Sinanodonta woodiana]|uniref:Uncharacterized protein n=1 Tax=Sinanodonta woodiana TaxID=1069815 RepID=A0ABD3XPB1_SINWO